MRARWLDPEVGRFLSVDPLIRSLEKPQSLNGYSYVENNPTLFVDPTGMLPIVTFGISTSGSLANPEFSFSLDVDFGGGDSGGSGGSDSSGSGSGGSGGSSSGAGSAVSGGGADAGAAAGAAQSGAPQGDTPAPDSGLPDTAKPPGTFFDRQHDAELDASR